MTAVLWFKRDLRLEDNAALHAACTKGDVMPLYIIEPELWQQLDTSNRQWQFIREALLELDQALKARGSSLIIRVGEASDVLSHLLKEHPFTRLIAHQETGNAWTYARDVRVAKWCKAHEVDFIEERQFGVIRPLKNRDYWVRQRDALMKQAVLAPPEVMNTPKIESVALPDKEAYGDNSYPCKGRQKGGRKAALSLLQSFFDQRGQNYVREMSSPLTGEESCSRLSPYITYGCVSIRELMHEISEQEIRFKAIPASERGNWLRSLHAFKSRLYWHCHFIQKLEDEPEIETEAMHKHYKGLRDDGWDEGAFHAWKTGHTGFPFIDACMRSLIHTGWLNFRMRAMLVSFASYQLWLDWQKPAHHLAQLFVDYEPGIHYSQMQMQSNTTGINTPRIYNPVKQSYDQDPTGAFIRRWVEELNEVPEEWIHEPWKMNKELREKYSASDYPEPIVNLQKAQAQARQKLGALRKTEGFWEESQRVIQKHGSRKSRHFVHDQTRQRMQKGQRPKKQKNQMELDV